MATRLTLTGFAGASSQPRRLLPDSIGVEAVNIRLGAGELQPWRAPAAVGGVTIGSGRKTLYRMGRAAGTASPIDRYWMSWTDVVHVVRDFVVSDTSERIAYTGDNSPKWTNNLIGVASAPYPTASRELAVPKPDQAPTAALVTDGSTGDSSTVFWCFTLVNDLGWESAPSPASPGLPIKPGAIVNLGLGGYTVPSGNYGVNRVRWYRTQTDTSGNAEFMFVREYAIGASGMQDDGRSVTETLASETWIPLDASAKYLTAFGAQLAAACVGKSVRWCEPGYIYAWPLDYEYKLAHEPVGLASFSQRLVVLTTGGITVMTGIDPGAMDQKDMHVPACQSPRSVVACDSGVAWASNSGIMWYGADGAMASLTAQWIKPDEFRAKYNPQAMHGAYYKGLLIFWFTGGSAGNGGFVVDPSSPSVGVFLSDYYSAAHWDDSTERLFVYSGTSIYEWQPDAGSFMTARFKSKVWRTPETWEPEMVDLTCDGTATVTMTIDGVTRFNRAGIPMGEYRVPNGAQGRDFQLEITADAPVTSVEVF